MKTTEVVTTIDLLEWVMWERKTTEVVTTIYLLEWVM